MGLDINKIASQMHCSTNEAVQRLKEDAILRAQYGVTEQQLNELLNGGNNWGRMMDEYAFNPDKAQEYKDNLPKAEKENQLAQARRRKSRENDFTVDMSKEQAELDKKRADLKRSIVEKRSQGITGYLSAMADRIKLDMTPEKAGQSEAGFGGVAGKFLVAAAVAAVAVAFTSCEKTDIDIGTQQEVAITIPKAPDYTELLIGIINRLDSMNNDNAKQWKALMEQLNIIINNQYATQDQLDKTLNALYDKIKNFLQQIVDNQISMQIDNNKNAADILAKLDQILNSNKSTEVKLDEIIKLLADIKGIGESIDVKLDGIRKQLAEALGNDQTIIAALAKLDANDQLTNQILNQILNAIGQLGSEYKGFFSAIINQVANNNAKMDDVNAMLRTINNNVTNLNALVKKYGDQGSVLGNAILNAIKNLDFSADIDLSGIEALLNKLVTGQGETNANISKLTEVFNKFSASTTLQLNTIIAKLDKSAPDYNAKLDAIIKLLEQLDANNDARNNKILAAIEKLGANLCVNLNAILAKLDKSAPDYSAKLDAIIKLLEQMDANNEARNKKILAAIEKLGTNISADLTAILNKIGKGGGEGQDYSAILEAILNKLGDMQADNNNNFAAVLKAIGNIDIQPTDLSWIKSHLDAILEAIKDHDVVVTVEGGKCCCCHQDGTPVHEGVLGDLNDLLG